MRKRKEHVGIHSTDLFQCDAWSGQFKKNKMKKRKKGVFLFFIWYLSLICTKIWYLDDIFADMGSV